MVVPAVVAPRALTDASRNVPAVNEVAPLYELSPEITQAPSPFLVSDVTPLVAPSTIAGASVLSCLLAPNRVSVRLPPLVAIGPVLVKTSGPVPDASMR